MECAILELKLDENNRAGDAIFGVGQPIPIGIVKKNSTLYVIILIRYR